MCVHEGAGDSKMGGGGGGQWGFLVCVAGMIVVDAHVYTCVCLCVDACVHTYTNTHVYTRMCVHMCVCVCLCVCVHIAYLMRLVSCVLCTS